MRLSRLLVALVGTALAGTPVLAQPPQFQGPGPTFPTDNPVLRAIWEEGMTRSQAYDLSQVLMDSIGPRLTGTPHIKRGNDWLVKTYQSWGVTARNEQYGTWKGWNRGITHIDLLQPRVRTLEGTLLAWSGGTPGGKPVTAPVVIIPDVADSAAFVAWLPQAKGKFVLISMAQPTCRPDATWQEFATQESREKMQRERTDATRKWNERLARTGYGTGLGTGMLGRRLEAAGVAGVIASRWSNGYGVNKIFDARTERVPSLDISCEDYGLLYRMAERNQGPVLRVEATAEFQGEVPVYNSVAEIKGAQKPDEYVMMSAHFDSWDAGSGATDNGTGTIVMMEALRILKKVYPNPKRTILVGHWSGEEQGLNGSRAFAADHPDVVKGLQALFNQDNGTGRITSMSASGLVGASGQIAKWGAQLPQEIARNITWNFPGSPAGGGSDHASFVCAGAPGFSLGALGWEYGNYTWHTNRDTFDKIVFDDLRNNAVLAAMLVYLAAEDDTMTPRDRRVMPMQRNPQSGQVQQSRWPECAQPTRASSGYNR